MDGSESRPFRWNAGTELRHAWRGVRARGSRAAFVIVLLSIVLAANGVMFVMTRNELFAIQEGAQLAR